MIQSVTSRNKRKRYAKRGNTPVTIDNAYLVADLFHRKTWDRYNGIDVIMQKYTVMLSKLNDSQQDLIIELSDRFLWITDYRDDILLQMNRILESYKNYQTYYVIRCVKEKEQKKAKSSGYVLYQIKEASLQSQLKKPVTFLDCMSDLRNVKDFDSSIFILVDDFIGTGDTAVECMDDLRNRFPGVADRMVVMCIAAMTKGKERLSALHVSVFASHFLDKGITDHYSGYRPEQKKQQMLEIERTLKINPSWSFGYGKSEALVCLIRCPNNTFPIYWNGNFAPYPRKGV